MGQRGEQALGVGIHRDMLDIRTGLGDGCGNLGQHAARILDLDVDADVEQLAFLRLPLDIDPFLRLG